MASRNGGARASSIRFGEHLTRAGELLRSATTSGPGIAWVTLFLLLPLAGIIFISFMTRGANGEIQWPLTFDNYHRLAGFGLLGFDPQFPQIILRSLVLGAGTTLACLAASFPLAFFIAAQPERRKQIALVLVVIPFWTNLLIRTYAWQILLGPGSALATLATKLGLSAEGMPLYPSTFAVYIGMLCAYLPFLVLPLYTAVEKLDWSIAEAAADLGADRLRVFRHAILPQLTPGVVAGIILVFIPATGQFVVPDLLGGAKTVMLGNAIQQQFGPSRDWPFGSAIAFVGMSVVLLGLFLQSRYAAAKGEEGLSVRRISLPLWLVSAFLYLFLYAPIVVVIVYSFNASRYGGPWRGFTTEWYPSLFDSADKLQAAKNTFVLAFASTGIATVLGTMLGYGLSRYRFPGKKVFSFLMYIPVVIPDIVMAVAMLMFYALVREQFGLLSLGMTTMVLSHVTFQIPFVAIVVRSRLVGMDPAIEEAAHDLGASSWQTFWHVTFPAILPAVVAGGMLAFTLSLDDFVVSFFTTGPGSTTLPILIYSSVKRGITPDINALSTLIVLVSILGTVAVTLLQRPRRNSGGTS